MKVLPGKHADKTTLRGFLERIERQYARRAVWLMDRGVPTEEVLARCAPRAAVHLPVAHRRAA